MPSRLNDTRSPTWALASVLLLALAAQLWVHVTRTSATVDEPFHILAGYRHWQCGDFGINPEHPPLLKLLAAAPLKFRELTDPPWECGSKYTPKFDGFSYGGSFLVENGVDDVVIPTRLAASLISLLLAALIFLAAWEMFGRWEALVALAIVAFEPSLIAHGSIVTTDMAISATAFGAVYALYRFRNRKTWQAFIVAGLAFGLMLAAKHSAVIFLPALFALFVLDGFVFRPPSDSVRRALPSRLLAFAGIFLIGLLILWSFYGFRYRAIPNTSAEAIPVANYISENANRPEAAESLSAKVTIWIGELHIFPESYVLGMADVISWSSRNTFLFGKNYPTGQWFFFPVAFAVKTNIALLVLLPLGLLLPVLVREKRREAMFLLLPAVLFFVVATTSNFTNSVRHILPIYPFLTVAAAAAAVWIARRFRLVSFALVTLLIFNAAAAVRTAPNYLVFANDLWGGNNATRRIFSGANVDTGQNIKLVNEYIAEHDIKDCWIVGFVHPEMLPYVQPCKPMPSGLRVMLSRNPIPAVPPTIEGTFFISSNELPPQGAREYTSIAKAEPKAVIGNSTLVFEGRFDVPHVAAISHVQRSGAFLRLGDVDNAIAEARQAIAFFNDDPRPHLALGLALVRANRIEEAKTELELATDIAANDPVFRNASVRARQELSKMK